ncbi:MAG TPA: nuclear transport factor 2 family protein [Micromonosporaceae bacterium]|nr:nuclear transport factor 2 family protein [Micromonosporaceae bacterium]
MIEESKRKDIILEHSRRLSAGDVDGLLELYAEDVSFEDPVGSGRQSGRDALRAHFEKVVEADTREVAGEPVAGQDGLHTLVPITAVMDYLPLGPVFADRGWLAPPPDPRGSRLRRDYVLMLRTGSGGLVEELKAFWGRSDLEVTG